MKLLLVDDHPLFREGLAMLLPRLDPNVVTTEASTCAEAVDLVSKNQDYDLILLDLGLPDVSGFEAIDLLRSRYPSIPVVVLSSTEDKNIVLQALDHGAMGFIPKTSTSDVLVGALKLVLSRGIYLPASVFLDNRNRIEARTADVPERRKTPAELGLTTRQADVLYLILQGKASKIICRELDLSASTVKQHTSAVLRALNVSTRTQAIVAAGRLGLYFPT